MALPSLLDEIDRLFDDLIHRRWGKAPRQLTPAVIQDTGDGWTIELVVTGLRATDLKVEAHGRQLTITGHRARQRSPHGGESAWRHEISLRQSIALPAEIDPDSVDAKLDGERLTIHARKRRV